MAEVRGSKVKVHVYCCHRNCSRSLARIMAAEDLRQRLAQSFAALKEYFDPSRGSEKIGNPGQLVLFAEHAIKVRRTVNSF